jgi:hypothetical protein
VQVGFNDVYYLINNPLEGLTMNKNNVGIVCVNICRAFDEMHVPTAMGVDILRLGLDADAELSVENPKESMRGDFIEMAAGMREMFLDGGDGITNEEIDAGFSELISDATTFLKDGPSAEQQAIIDLMKAATSVGGGNEKSSGTLH